MSEIFSRIIANINARAVAHGDLDFGNSAVIDKPIITDPRRGAMDRPLAGGTERVITPESARRQGRGRIELPGPRHEPKGNVTIKVSGNKKTVTAPLNKKKPKPFTPVLVWLPIFRRGERPEKQWSWRTDGLYATAIGNLRNKYDTKLIDGAKPEEV